MSNNDPLNPGQQVFLKRPLQIYATVKGRPDGDSLLPGDQVRYAVQLLPLEQIYLPEELELSVQPLPNNSQLSYIASQSAKEPAHFNEAAPSLSATDSFQELAQEVNNAIALRAYQLYSNRGFEHGHDREDWLQAVSEILLNVPADITETPTQLTIYADVPGVSAKDLEVRVATRAVCISGKRRSVSERAEGKAVHSERRSNQIFRVLDLPSEINPDSLRASLSDGVLELDLLKADKSNVLQFHTKATAA